ncbi:MAG: haloalkane dehalogenase [Actinomycetota bacterium]|nr:haloalkane dehalogenase [Acidimicrobiia bacterium]MDQ3293746.1 haloalkane dehalogenase [Actinomycetota bacterium]
MDSVRTPDEAFTDLPDFPWDPSYVEVAAGDGSAATLRVAYIDAAPEGEPSGETVLLLHGEPSWSFLYRHMIRPLVAEGHRCIAPDLVGFGRSDKPTPRTEYTYQRHVDWLREALFDRLDLTGLTLVCQDWGGLLGLRLLAEHPNRFRRAVAANTFLPTGDKDPGKAFRNWREFSQSVETFSTSFIIDSGTTSELSPEVRAAYDAPFPDESYKEGARQFPMLVPATPDDPAAEPNRAAWAALRTLDVPFLCAFSDEDPITAGADAPLREQIPGAQGRPHTVITGGGHFLQEDRGPELAAVVSAFITET